MKCFVLKPTALVASLFMLIPVVAAGQILPPTAGYSVDVAFSDSLGQRMGAINNLEQQLEERFRENRHYAKSPREAGSQRFAATLTAGTEWAGERLIGEISEFSLDNLVKALVAYNVNRAAPEFGGRIEITIDALKLSNASIAFLESFQSYAAGRVKVIAADGDVLLDREIRANLVTNPTVDRAYKGPALAFAETDPSRRVGPTLAYFVEQALERVWPDDADAIVGPVIVRISGPHESLTGHGPANGARAAVLDR